jgi:hypothetical protein
LLDAAFLLRGRNKLERPNENDGTRTNPPPQEPDEKWTKNGTEDDVNWRNRSGWKEGVLGHESELLLKLLHDLRAPAENPAAGRDLDA